MMLHVVSTRGRMKLAAILYVKYLRKDKCFLGVPFAEAEETAQAPNNYPKIY